MMFSFSRYIYIYILVALVLFIGLTSLPKKVFCHSDSSSQNPDRRCRDLNIGGVWILCRGLNLFKKLRAVLELGCINRKVDSDPPDDVGANLQDLKVERMLLARFLADLAI